MAYSNPIPELEDRFTLEPEYESDYTQIKEVYFAFIDVLGFKKTFDDIKISKEKNIAEKYRDVFNYYFSLMNAANFMEKGMDTGCYAGQTSDSLFFYTDRTDYLLQFIKIFSHFNLYAMSKNVFFRGGIAKGSLYKKEKYQFYGDSVIGAYLLEEKISMYPIVTIDEKTHQDLQAMSGYLSFVESGANQDRHYIKPFALLNSPFTLDLDEGFIIKDIDKMQIEKNILENKSAFEFDAENYAKYIFLIDKFNKEKN